MDKLLVQLGDFLRKNKDLKDKVYYYRLTDGVDKTSQPQAETDKTKHFLQFWNFAKELRDVIEDMYEPLMPAQLEKMYYYVKELLHQLVDDPTFATLYDKSGSSKRKEMIALRDYFAEYIEQLETDEPDDPSKRGRSRAISPARSRSPLFPMSPPRPRSVSPPSSITSSRREISSSSRTSPVRLRDLSPPRKTEGFTTPLSSSKRTTREITSSVTKSSTLTPKKTPDFADSHRVSQLQSENSELKQRLFSEEQRNNALASQLNQLQNAVSDLKNELNREREELAMSSRRYKDELAKQTSMSRESIDRIQRQLNDSKRDIDQLQLENAQLRREVDGLRIENEQLKIASKNKDQCITEYKKIIDEFDFYSYKDEIKRLLSDLDTVSLSLSNEKGAHEQTYRALQDIVVQRNHHDLEHQKNLLDYIEIIDRHKEQPVM